MTTRFYLDPIATREQPRRVLFNLTCVQRPMMNVGPQMTPTGPPVVKWPATYDGTVPRQLGIATILHADSCGPDKTQWNVKFLFPGANVPGVGVLKIELTEPEFRVHA